MASNEVRLDEFSDRGASDAMKGDEVAAFFLRLLVGGLLVAVIPVVSRKFSPVIAGTLLIIPAVTLIGLFLIGRAEGSAAMSAAALSAILTLPTVFVFLVSIYLLSSKAGLDVIATLAVSLVVWITVAIPVALLLSLDR